MKKLDILSAEYEFTTCSELTLTNVQLIIGLIAINLQRIMRLINHLILTAFSDVEGLIIIARC